MASEEMSPSYAERVGERLRAVRKQKAMSLQGVEAASHQEFKASVLGAYERGERAISVPRLQRLADFYNVPVDQLLPRDVGGALAARGASAAGDLSAPAPQLDAGAGAGGAVEGDKVTIDLTRLETTSGPEPDLLRRYLVMIQVQRQDFNGRVLTIRDEDVRAIAMLFETTPEAMRRRLDDLGLRLHA